MGHLLKIDELTSSLTRSKFAQVCIEIDLSKPLCHGFWVGDDRQKVFVVGMYERLPTFCYNCVVVGHGTNSCNQITSSEHEHGFPPLCASQRQAVSLAHVSDVSDQM